MEMAAAKTHPFSSSFKPKIILTQRHFADIYTLHRPFRRKCLPCKMVCNAHQLLNRSTTDKRLHAIQAVSSDVQDIGVSPSYDGFTVTTSDLPHKENKIKITAEVSGMKTQEIFDDVFSKMVAAAQPIPGFRRVKGGKTPNIPTDVLLEILGPSRVYKEVITKIINSTVAEYISKEGLKVGKDLQVEQSLEDLEAEFEPGDSLTFDAIVECLE